MNRIISNLKRPFPAFVLVLLILVSLSCNLPDPFSASSPEASLAPAPTVTPETTPGAPPPADTPPATVPTPETPSPTPETTPPQTTPPTAGSPIITSWAPPPIRDTTPPAGLADIVAEVLPWVVSINVEVTSTGFFGQPSVQQGAGSGWIIDSNGLIVTNSHVIEGAQSVTVSLNDGRVFAAEQIAADPASDLAVMKIEAAGLPVAVVGDSSNLRPGMMVLAIGNALGAGISVTAGWVSQLETGITVPAAGPGGSETLSDLIKISAPINPGNSGGPLVNMLGEVVGITNAKLVAAEVENVGYAISTRTALPIIQQLVETGRIVRPYMGVSLQTLTPEIASMLGLAVDEGALVMSVEPGSPADDAGLQEEDIITRMGDRDISSVADAVEVIRSSQVGEQLEVTFYRGDTSSTARITLGQVPSS